MQILIELPDDFNTDVIKAVLPPEAKAFKLREGARVVDSETAEMGTIMKVMSDY